MLLCSILCLLYHSLLIDKRLLSIRWYLLIRTILNDRVFSKAWWYYSNVAQYITTRKPDIVTIVVLITDNYLNQEPTTLDQSIRSLSLYVDIDYMSKVSTFVKYSFSAFVYCILLGFLYFYLVRILHFKMFICLVSTFRYIYNWYMIYVLIYGL